jgi:hypothetical protein
MGIADVLADRVAGTWRNWPPGARPRPGALSRDGSAHLQPQLESSFDVIGIADSLDRRGDEVSFWGS